MFCPQCGAQLPDGSKFCGKCGAQIGGAAPVPGAPASQPGPIVTPQPKKGLDPKVRLGIIGAVVVIAVAAIIFGIVSCVSGGHGSAQGIADGVNSAFGKMIDSDFSSSSVTEGMNALIDLMPQEVIDQELQQQGMTRDDLTQMLESQLGGLDQLSSYMGMVDMSVSTSVGDPLDADELEDVNDDLGEYGLAATEGNRIVVSMQISALGQSQNQDMDELCAVKIGGSWYLWGGI
ncbi:zinc-ribbon domain-containing protein [Thermophilibacter sp.]